MIKLSSPVIAGLTSAVFAAGADAPEAVPSPELRAAVTRAAQVCTILLGTAIDVQADSKALHARLEGDVAGTLQITEHSQWQVGAVERSSAVFSVDVDAGAIVFGDGTVGRVPPSGSSQVGAYRYQAAGKVDGGTGPYSQASGHWEINGWVSDDPNGTSLDYRIVVCTD